MTPEGFPVLSSRTSMFCAARVGWGWEGGEVLGAGGRGPEMGGQHRCWERGEGGERLLSSSSSTPPLRPSCS